MRSMTLFLLSSSVTISLLEIKALDQHVFEEFDHLPRIRKSESAASCFVVSCSPNSLLKTQALDQYVSKEYDHRLFVQSKSSV